MGINVIGPDWPTTRALRAALADAPEIGTLQWGASPCDKVEALGRLAAAGLQVPTYTEKREVAEGLLAEGREVWGRKRRHSHGTDIAIPKVVMVQGDGWLAVGRRWRTSEWWVVPVADVAYEARAHVWGGKCFRLGIKEFHGVPAGRPAGKCQVVRSDRNGWELCYAQRVFDAHTTPDSRALLRRTAVAACKALGVEGGAVDLLVTTTGEVYVLEVNTAPALGPESLAAWVERIRVVAQRQMQKEQQV